VGSHSDRCVTARDGAGRRYFFGVRTAEERWREKPPGALTFWLLVTVAVIGFAVEVLATSWVKGLTAGIAVLCSALASVAWRSRQQHHRVASD
jgi:hypothetical protein